MKEQELMKIEDAMIKEEYSFEAKQEAEAGTFSIMDEEAKQEPNCIDSYLQKQKDSKSVKDALKAKLNLKKVEGLFGDIAVVSDKHYRMCVVTLDGEIIVPFGKYGWIGSFGEDGTAPVRDGKRFSSRKDAKWGAINKEGEEVRPLAYCTKKAKHKQRINYMDMNEDDYFSIDKCFDQEGNFDYERLEDAIMDGEYVPEDW